MNKFKTVISELSIVFIFLLLYYGEVSSQTYVDVLPGFSTLNDAITNNTDPNAIFRLQRGAGAIYLLNGSITNKKPLQIEAAAGTDARPQIIPGIGSGGVSDIAFRAKANLTLKGVYVAGKDEGGAYLSQIIRVQADKVKLYLYDCFLENTAQSAIRTDNKLSKIYLINSNVRNCVSDYANGRGIDDRGVDMDTLYVENCTIYSIGSKFLRDGGGVLNYAFINHNTFMNNAIQVMQFGECPKVVFKNNLIIDCGFMGHGVHATNALLQLKPLTSSVYAGLTQTVDVQHNNFYINPQYSMLYADTVIMMPNYDAQMQAMVTVAGKDNTNISEQISFTFAPPIVSSLVPQFWNDPLGESSTTAVGLRVNGNYNFAYLNSARSYSYGTANQPIGALTWFNIAVGVKDNLQLPVGYKLFQNYPNPFNPTTNINYSLSKNADVELTIYNSLGQVVRTLVNSSQPAGSYSVMWDGSNQAGQKLASGIYLYKLTTGDFVTVKKMILMK